MSTAPVLHRGVQSLLATPANLQEQMSLLHTIWSGTLLFFHIVPNCYSFLKLFRCLHGYKSLQQPALLVRLLRAARQSLRSFCCLCKTASSLNFGTGSGVNEGKNYNTSYVYTSSFCRQYRVRHDEKTLTFKIVKTSYSNPYYLGVTFKLDVKVFIYLLILTHELKSPPVRH